MDSTLDSTTLSTISSLEARLLRVEHLLYGSTATLDTLRNEPATESLESLERRLHALLGRIKVYGELMKIRMSFADFHLLSRLICNMSTDPSLDKSHPTLFHPPPSEQAPIDLTSEAIRATVIASAASFPATASSLTSVSDCPIPDPAQSASLAALIPRMRGVEATQYAREAEMAELRGRSEAVLRFWYERGIMTASRFVADVEGRIEKVERQVKKAERQREDQEAL